MSLGSTIASASALAARLVGETKTLIGAEAALGKARIGDRISPYRRAAVFFGVAALLAIAGLIALFVGLIMAVATLIGPGLATLAVVVGVFVVAGVFALIGKAQLSSPKGRGHD